MRVPIAVMCALKSPSPMRMERTSVRLRSIIWVAKCSSAPYRCRGRAAPVAVGRRKCGDAARVKGGIEVESPARSFVVNDRVVMHLQARVEAVERGRTALTHSGYVSKHSAVAPCAAARPATEPRLQPTSRYVHGRARQPRSIELSTSAVSVSGSLHLSAAEAPKARHT